jgi:acid phosphatase type 7
MSPPRPLGAAARALCAGVATLILVAAIALPATAARRVVVAAGDIASKGSGDARTARLVLRLHPARVLTLGDNAYRSGTREQFRRYYDPAWGRFRSKTSPSLGNHDHETPGASGYFGYFGSRAPAKNYRFVLGDWLLVSLDAWSNRAGAESFLRRSLGVDHHRCELVYWHQPRWSSGEHGSRRGVSDLWALATRMGVDVVLNGHDHDYERFARLNASGKPSPSGTREFVVGTGGVGLRGFRAPIRGSQKRIKSLGVLRMQLGSGAYFWSFRSVANRSLDHGSTACHR